MATGPTAVPTSGPSAAPTAELDAKELGRFALKVWKYKEGEVVSLMIQLGDRLGLYRSLAGAGVVTPAELASRTGLHERWLQEWLRAQAAAGLIASDDGEHFELTPIGVAVLADEEGSLHFAAGAFARTPPPGYVDKLCEAFRTGIGLSYDDLGPSAAHSTERSLGPWSRLALVPKILPALDGVVDELLAGAVVADVGCGAGVALCTMAAAFPASTFHGFDLSRHAIERAAVRVAELGLTNVELHQVRGEALPTEATFDLILTFDCLHDMTNPEGTMAAIRRAIHPDGTWLIKEIRGHAAFAENLRNPLVAMMYSTSVASCMSSALSEPGGAGLGTLGLHRERCEDMTRRAGFTRFAVHDLDDPANLYYEVRP
jgi:2-polyprenyl-3-methyl-5-hydroxy-6-metoxy-1,4-benzoquinol methylase